MRAWPIISARTRRYCERLLAEKGLLLLPSSLFDGMETEPCFRVGFGRENLGECLAVWDSALQDGLVPSQAMGAAAAVGAANM